MRHDQLQRFRINLDRFAAFRQRHLHIAEVMLGDFAHFVVRERREQYHFVDPVAEFRRETPLELADDLALHLLDADAARQESERTRQLAEMLRPDVRGHDHDRV